MPTEVKHDEESFKYFIGYIDGDVVKSQRIMLPQMSNYIKCFDGGGKNVIYN